ncbi:MAG: hypothetical protein GY820_02670, partial [Gammaproteobacteria bacterium]|nr:hypothetical protein [Gammaproteobacteria bacterium]
MGGRLSAFLASICMNSFDSNINLQLPPQSLYVRYMDDILVYTSVEPQNLLEVINAWHPSIQFKLEQQPSLTAHYLDLTVSIVDNAFTTAVYHKPTETGRTLHWTSATTMASKKAALLFHLRRAYSHSSATFSKNQELARAITMFYKHGFPASVIWNSLTGLFSPKQPPRLMAPPVIFPCLPEKMQHYIRQRLRRFHLRPSFRPGRLLQTFLPMGKDSPIKIFRSNIVYKLSCQDCDMFNIGQTSRPLVQRIQEHN